MPVVTRSKSTAAKASQQPAIMDTKGSRQVVILPGRRDLRPLASVFPKLDLSKMPKRPISAPFVFPKSTEQKLAEALAEIEALKKTVQIVSSGASKVDDARMKEIDSLKKKNENLEANVKYLEGEIDSWKEQYDSALDRCNTLRERIVNPFKSAIRSPY